MGLLGQVSLFNIYLFIILNVHKVPSFDSLLKAPFLNTNQYIWSHYPMYILEYLSNSLPWVCLGDIGDFGDIICLGDEG